MSCLVLHKAGTPDPGLVRIFNTSSPAEALLRNLSWENSIYLMMASLGGIGLYSRHLTDDDVSNIGAATRYLVITIFISI